MIDVRKINAWVRTDVAILIGALATGVVLLGSLVWLVMRHDEPKHNPLDYVCYGVYGSSGRFYPSAQPAYFAGGLWFVITHENWHAVGDFEATYADRECLRQKYPDEPQLVPDELGVDK